MKLKRFSAIRWDQRGYTLAELLVTIAILGLVMGAVLGVQMTSNTMFLRGENQAEAQQDARAAMLMEEDFRMIGYGCPDNGCPTPPPAGAQQKISAASSSAVTFWADTTNVSSTLTANVAAAATTLPVTSAAGFAVNDRVYLNNGATWETRVITGIAGNNLTVAALTNAYPQGVQVGRPRQIQYSVGGGALSRDAGDGNGLQTMTTGVIGLTFTFYDTNDTVITSGNLNANLANIRRVLIQATTQSAQSSAGPSTFTINTNVRPRNM
jgi:prepilin-type N-terminal cleavage/methylation domain-containing protein